MPNGPAPLLIALFLFASTSFAATIDQKSDLVSFSSVFKELGIEDRDNYPIETFAATENGRHLAIVFTTGVVSEGSELNRYPTLINVTDGVTQVLRSIKPLDPVPSWARASNLKFLSDRWLRVEWIWQDQVKIPGLSFRRNYQFYDILTDRSQTLAEILGIPSVFNARAFAERYYLVTQQFRRKSVHHVVEMDPQTKMPQLLGEIEDDVKAKVLLQQPVDRVGGDVRRLGPRQLEVKALYTDGHNYREEFALRIHGDEILISDYLSLYDLRILSHQQRLVEGEVNLFSEVRGKTLFISQVDTKKTIKKYQVPTAAIYSPLMRIEGGYIATYPNHPYNGFLFLTDEGEVKSLTDPEKPTVIEDIHSQGIWGFGASHPDGTVDLMRLNFFNSVENELVGLGYTAGQPQAYPVISKIFDDRYVLVQIDEKKIGLVDLQIDELMVAKLELADSLFTFKVSDKSIRLDYPTLGRFEQIDLAKIRRNQIPSSVCDRLLKKRRKL